MRIKEPFEKNKVFFISDTHFFHHNIIKYCDRPFSDIYDMNETIIQNWNHIVPEDGVVFHLGDFSLGAGREDKEKGPLIELLWRLNGTIYLTVGNHEGNVLNGDVCRNRFEEIADILEITIKDEEVSHSKQDITMCHYPMIVWNASHKGSWQLFGHVHGFMSNKGKIQHKPSQLDVGVDNVGFSPISYEKVKELITKQSLRQ